MARELRWSGAPPRGGQGARARPHRKSTARSAEGQEQKRWYGLARWKRTRARQLQEHPLCARCLQVGLVTAATVADHVVPPRGDWDLFWNGDLQSLCAPHHDEEKQREEALGHSTEVGDDGSPLDPRHPWMEDK